MNKHGQIRTEWQDDLFVIYLEGPFNEIGIEYWAKQLQEEIKSKGLTNWKRLEVWDDETLGSPKVLDIGKSMYQWYITQGCNLAAVVVSNSLQEDLIKSRLESNVEIFYDLNSARMWLD